MGSLSNYAENKFVEHILGTAYTAPSTVYLALFESDPTDAGSGTEASYTSYARKVITFGAASSRRVTQSGDVSFDQCTGGSNDVTHWGVYDALTSGNLLAHGALNATKNIVNGSTPSVASAEVYVEISAGAFSNYAANGFLDLMFRNQAFSAPTTYIGLSTGTVSDASTGSTVLEPSGGSYGRVAVNATGGGSPAWSAASGGASSNGADVSFPSPTGSWGTVVAAFAANTSVVGTGELLFYDNDNVTDQAITSGDTVKFASGQFDVSMT